jgi:hypothetical protein
MLIRSRRLGQLAGVIRSDRDTDIYNEFLHQFNADLVEHSLFVTQLSTNFFSCLNVSQFVTEHFSKFATLIIHLKTDKEFYHKFKNLFNE